MADTAVWSQVVDRLVTVWTAAAGAGDGVYDGPPVTADLVTRWVTVGYQEDVDQGPSGQLQVSEEYDGLIWRESGTVLCQIIVVSGDSDGIAGVRTSAFAFLQALTDAVVADKLAGVLGEGATVQLTAQPEAVRAAQGSEYRIHISLTYSIDVDV